MDIYKTSYYTYELPPELIAQTPLQRRDSSRLMVLDRGADSLEHRSFSDLPDYLRSGDCLVMNDSRVIPARLVGKRLPGGGVCEVLLLTDRGDGLWECLVRPGRRIRKGMELSFGDGALTGTVEEELEAGGRLIRFAWDGIFLEVLERLGEMPLPPYIKEKLGDPERYQTVYSRNPGSAAAPTAGLHFTKELLQRLERRGIRLCYVTLHVGLGTFRPVKEENILEHKMHSEYCIVSEDAARCVTETRRGGGRVFAVGTTSCRTLESFCEPDGTLRPRSGWTDIFIYPGFQFRCVDALITNFHLPESTLLMLVSAFAGRERILEAYRCAVERKYRFFSFGDAMLIL